MNSEQEIFEVFGLDLLAGLVLAISSAMRIFGDEVGAGARQAIPNLVLSDLRHVSRLQIAKMVEGVFETTMVTPNNVFERFDVARRLDFGEGSAFRTGVIVVFVEICLVKDIAIVFTFARNEGHNVRDCAGCNLRVDEVHSLVIALSLWNDVFGASTLGRW